MTKTVHNAHRRLWQQSNDRAGALKADPAAIPAACIAVPKNRRLNPKSPRSPTRKDSRSYILPILVLERPSRFPCGDRPDSGYPPEPPRRTPVSGTECSETAPPSPQSGPAPPDAGTVCGHRPRPPPEAVPRRRVRYDTAGAVKSRLLAACHTKQTPFCSIFHRGKNLSPSPKQKASAAPDLPQKADAVLPRLNKADFRQPYTS